MTSYKSKLKKGLPKTTLSLCPLCKRKLQATIFARDGTVYMSKECPEHGEFEDRVFGSEEMYLSAERFAYDAPHPENFDIKLVEGCPEDCGLCDKHMGNTDLANIDVTNRCNLNCSFCFANARACGFVYEPSFDDLVKMMEKLRAEKPVPPPAVQFSGGEPTLRDDLPELISKAKELGFVQVQIAHNGIRLAREPDYAEKLVEAGLSTVYMHFDGSDKKHDPLFKIRDRAIKNAKEAHLGVVLVPTLINGENDDNVGDMIKYAIRNVDVVRGVNFQPVSFTGAMSQDKVKEQRYTIPDMVKDIEAQLDGAIAQSDFYPIPCVVPISRLVEKYAHKPKIKLSSHPHCGMATYLFVSGERIVPITRFIDVERFFEIVDDIADKMDRNIISRNIALMRGLNAIRKCVDDSKVPDDMDIKGMLSHIIKKRDFSALSDFHWNTLFIGSMHFMDCFNYDVERVKRCVIHYATPDPERPIVPFCAYNSGPVYREIIWEKFSIPTEEWQKQHGEMQLFDEVEVDGETA